jgi:Hypoxia induced protein conserved region
MRIAADRCAVRKKTPLARVDSSRHIARMTTFLTILLVLAMLGTLSVLGFGVATLLRGGDPRRSNKLMQSRVIMQALALVLLAMLMLLARH